MTIMQRRDFLARSGGGFGLLGLWQLLQAEAVLPSPYRHGAPVP